MHVLMGGIQQYEIIQQILGASEFSVSVFRIYTTFPDSNGTKL